MVARCAAGRGPGQSHLSVARVCREASGRRRNRDRRNGCNGRRADLSGISTFTGRVDRRHDIIIGGAVGERGVVIGGRSGRADLRDGPAGGRRALHVVAGGAAARRPGEGCLRIAGSCHEIGRCRRRRARCLGGRGSPRNRGRSVAAVL